MAKNKWLELSEHPGDSDDKDEISADSNSDEVPNEGESNWYYFDSDGTAAVSYTHLLCTPGVFPALAFVRVSANPIQTA